MGGQTVRIRTDTASVAIFDPAVLKRVCATFSVTPGLMKPSNDVSLDFVVCVLLDGCSEPTCISYIPPLGAQCGTLICSEAGHCATNAGTGQ